MRSKNLFRAIACITAMASFATDSMALSGKFRGNLTVGASEMPLVFNFAETSADKLEATLDSPRQNATGIPLDVKYCTKDSISLECKMIGASYNARIFEGKIEGTFTQRGFSFPLVLLPEEPLTTRRPQTPIQPFPYIEKDTIFHSSDGTKLAGTITLPEKSFGATFPMVVMVTGSGPQNRDEEVFEHRPFAVLADYLARHGIASFRYDDRGTAMSEGDYSKASIDTFLKDLGSAFEFANGLPESGKTGILGHSEGGSLAVLYGAAHAPDFIISLAGMVVPAKETLLAQNMRALEKIGLSDKQKDASIKLIELTFDEIINQYRCGRNEPLDIDLICRENSLDVPVIILESLKSSNNSRSDYFNSMVSLDPTDSLKKLKCAVLAINGKKDTQVNAETNLGAFRKYVSEAEVWEMENLNHLLQHAVTGDSSEYNEIKETISPEVLKIIADFILCQ